MPFTGNSARLFMVMKQVQTLIEARRSSGTMP